MFQQNLDISLISPQQPEQTLRCNQLDQDTSLEEILDEFSKQKSCPKQSSAPQDEIKKVRTLPAKPTERIPSLLLTTEPIISSSDHAKFVRHVQIPRREVKTKTSPPILSIQLAKIRPSIEMIHNMQEIDSKGANLASNLLSGSDLPDIKSASTNSGGSNTLGSDLNCHPTHIRRLSSTHRIETIQSPSRIIGDPLANMMPNAPNRVPTRPKFNTDLPEKNLNQSPSMKRNRPDLAGSSFINSPQSAKSLIKPKSNQLKIGSPSQDGISGEYLARVLQRSGASLGGSNAGSNPGSNRDSPRVPEIAENNEFRLTKRGSFSVFRKIVEAEVVKDI